MVDGTVGLCVLTINIGLGCIQVQAESDNKKSNSYLELSENVI